MPRSRKPRPSPTRPSKARRLFEMQSLEAREMLTVAGLASQEQVTTPIAPVLASRTAPATIALAGHFTDPLIPGTVVTINTTGGPIAVALSDGATPRTVANFLNYVGTGAYDGTFFHRSVNLAASAAAQASNPNAPEVGGSPSAPANVIQGGGYKIDNSNAISHIQTDSPVADEFSSRPFGDVAGTIAMAKTSSPNSATSEFYFNVTDNSSAFDTPTDVNGVETSYTTFGAVVGGQDLVNEIAALNTVAIDQFSDVPVAGVKTGSPVTASNLIYINSTTAAAGTTYQVSSSNPGLVTPTLNSGSVSLAYGTGLSGTALITVKAFNYDGTSAIDTFSVTVPAVSDTTSGPTAVADVSKNVQNGTTGSVDVLANDTDALAALNSSTLSIVTGPAHGTAVVNGSTGQIDYTPTKGFVGTDSLTYTVKDTAGTQSAVTTVTLNSVGDPVTLTIGTKTAKYLLFTQPDGAVGKVVVGGFGTALITFTSFDVQTTTKAGIVTATGSGAAIQSIAVSDSGTRRASLTITSPNTLSIGSITNPSAMSSIVAPTTTITNQVFIGHGLGAGIGNLTLGALSGATVNFNDYTGGYTTVDIPTATNSSFNGGSILLFRSKDWLNTDGGAYTITANVIFNMYVTGSLADRVVLNGKGYNTINAQIANPSADWTLNGSIYRAVITNPTSAWNVNSGGVIQNMTVKGSLTSTIQAAAISSLNVTGTMTNAVVQTDATFNKRYQQLGRLTVGGAVTNSVIFSAGNVGAISAPSFAGSRIFAGTSITDAQNITLPASTSDFTAVAKINSVTVTGRTPTFSNSLIAASQIGSLKLGTIATANAVSGADVKFGVAGHTLGAITGSLDARPFAFTKAQLKSAATLSAFETAKSLALGDFEVVVV